MVRLVDMPRVLVEVGGEVWQLTVLLETEGDGAGRYTGMAINHTTKDTEYTDVPRTRIGDALRGVTHVLYTRLLGSPAEDVRRSREFAAKAGVPQNSQ